MAFYGPMPSDVGLRLLLYPIGSNIVVRTACCTIGIALPVYSTFKAIERKDPDEQQKCLLYWAAYGSFSIAELFSDKLLYWFPLYYHLKFAFLVWLQLPSANGARQIYMAHLRPFFSRHQARLDQIIGFFYSEMARFVSAHQAEFQFAKKLVLNVLTAAHQMVRDILHPMPRTANRAIGGPPRHAQDSNSESEE
ncbi:hypothetical protein Ancab_018133 [Ancistrocladus abbreviatus]